MLSEQTKLMAKLALSPELNTTKLNFKNKQVISLSTKSKTLPLNKHGIMALNSLINCQTTTLVELDAMIDILLSPVALTDILSMLEGATDKAGQLALFRIVNNSAHQTIDPVQSKRIAMIFDVNTKLKQEIKALKKQKTPVARSAQSVQSVYVPPRSDGDAWRQEEMGGSWRNTSTGETVNDLPSSTFVDGPYGGSYEKNHWYTDKNGNAVKAKSALDAEFRGEDPWAHG